MSRKNPVEDMLDRFVVALGESVFGTVFPGVPVAANAGCKRCGGRCPCHVSQFGMPCPEDCPNSGKILDGCHLCRCKPAKKGKRVKAALTGEVIEVKPNAQGVYE